MSDCAMLWYC